MAEPSLLGIPLELRLKILKGCMVIGMAEIHNPWGQIMYRAFKVPEASSQLLRVCKQLYAEGLPILYGENVLFYGTQKHMARYLSRVSLKARAMIKHVCVRRNLGINKQAELLGTLTGLRSFNCFIHDDRANDSRELYYNYRRGPHNNRDKHLKPPRRLFASLTENSMLVEVGVIFGIGGNRLDTELTGEMTVRHKAVLTGQKFPNDLTLKLVYSSRGKNKDFHDLFPMSQKHMLNSAGRLVAKYG